MATSAHPRGQTPTPVIPGFFDSATGNTFSQVTDAAPLPVTAVVTVLPAVVNVLDAAAPAALLGGPVPVNATAGGVVLAAAAATRHALTFYNNGAQPVAVGPVGLTYANAPVIIPPGVQVNIDEAGGSRLAWNGITAGTTEEIRVLGPV